MNEQIQSEKSFEEKELEEAERELERAKKSVQELEQKVQWIKENIEIAKELREKINWLCMKSLEVHSSSMLNIRIEIEAYQRSFASDDINKINTILKPWYPNGVQCFETYYDPSQGILNIRLWC